MAKDSSFDIVSEFDFQELVNSVDQTKREINSRFDLKDTNSKIEIEEQKKLVITSSDDLRVKNILDILYSKMAKRGLSLKILDAQKVEHALGGNVRQEFILQKGIEQDLAKKIVACIKSAKLKVQASIQADQVRVSGKNKDDLQEVIQLLRDKQDDFNVPLQFVNYR